MMGGYRGMIGGNGQASGMMAYGYGDDHCCADNGYAGSVYGANATPIHKWREASAKILEVEQASSIFVKNEGVRFDIK